MIILAPASVLQVRCPLLKQNVSNFLVIGTLYNKRIITCLCDTPHPSASRGSSGQSGLPRSGRDQLQHAGADLAHVRGGSAADLHADAERLVPALHKLGGVRGPAEEPGGASARAIDCIHPPQGGPGSCWSPARFHQRRAGNEDYFKKTKKTTKTGFQSSCKCR